MTQETNKNKVTIKDIIKNTTKQDLKDISLGFLLATLSPVSVAAIVIGIVESTQKPTIDNIVAATMLVLSGLAGTTICTANSMAEFKKAINNIKNSIATKNALVKNRENKCL